MILEEEMGVKISYNALKLFYKRHKVRYVKP
jgi:transposase